jgi:hypothetical protein
MRVMTAVLLAAGRLAGLVGPAATGTFDFFDPTQWLNVDTTCGSSNCRGDREDHGSVGEQDPAGHEDASVI